MCSARMGLSEHKFPEPVLLPVGGNRTTEMWLSAVGQRNQHGLRDRGVPSSQALVIFLKKIHEKEWDHSPAVDECEEGFSRESCIASG